ncbi:acyltransferase family protein [Modestobacter sp. URMC 112]
MAVGLQWRRRATAGARTGTGPTATAGDPDRAGHFRGDIQGLRAVAVGLVVAAHLLGWPRGGFVGVDVFFVISGFLITGLLLRELERTGRISFRDFYVRRVRRILPVALVTLLVTVAAMQLLIGGSRAQQTLVEAGFAAVFAANVHFAAAGTDYFAASAPPSPLQHFWSLAVEEQFYVVWPVLLLLVALAAARLARRPRPAVAVASAVVVVASLAWSVVGTTLSPETAYFSTATRAWELGVGALLAVGARRIAALPVPALTLAAWTGLLGIAAAALLVTDDTAFPGFAAALPVGGAALLIAGGSRAGRWAPGELFLSHQPFRYVGDVSYSLYLWHWPLFVVATALVPLDSPVSRLALVAAALALAATSYHLVEQPVARSGWLLREDEKWRRHTSAGTSDHRPLTPRTAWAVGLSLLAAGTVTGALLGTPTAATAVADTADDRPLDEQIDGALTAESWPALEPSIDEVLSGSRTPEDVRPCAGAVDLDVEECTWGPASADRTAVLIGDSTAVAYVPALQEFVESADGEWRVVSAAMNGCEFVDVTIPHSTSVDAACPERKDDAVALVERLQPDLVVVTHAYIGHEDADGQELTPAAWATSLEGYLEQFSADAGELVLMAPPPQGRNPEECYTRLSSPKDCVSSVNDEWSELAAAEEGMARSLGAVYVDSRPWFCSDDGECPIFVGSTLTRFDGLHVTADYARKIAPTMAEALEDARP